MPTRYYVPRGYLKDLPVGQLPDGPTITVAILAFDLVHLNEVSCVVSKLRAPPYLSIVVFYDQSTAVVKHTGEGMTYSPGKLELVPKLVAFPSWSRRHMNP